MWILYLFSDIQHFFQFNSTLWRQLNAQMWRIVILKFPEADRKWRKSEQKEKKNLKLMMDILKFHTLAKEGFSCLSQYWECRSDLFT